MDKNGEKRWIEGGGRDGDLGGVKGGRDAVEREKKMEGKLGFECFNLGE